VRSLLNSHISPPEFRDVFTICNVFIRYDLLAEDLESSHDMKKELPRVHLREDSDGNIHLRNLSAHPSGSEEEALNYLFVGDTNRHVSETTMNLESSRSHCIFTIFITASKIGSDTVLPHPPLPPSARAHAHTHTHARARASFGYHFHGANRCVAARSTWLISREANACTRAR
jgi:hypothetical protein